MNSVPMKKDNGFCHIKLETFKCASIYYITLNYLMNQVSLLTIHLVLEKNCLLVLIPRKILINQELVEK